MKRDYYKELLTYISNLEMLVYDETDISENKRKMKVRKKKENSEAKSLDDCREVIKKHFAKEMFKDTKMTKYEFETLDGDLRKLYSKKKDKHYKREVETIRQLLMYHYSEEAKKLVRV